MSNPFDDLKTDDGDEDESAVEDEQTANEREAAERSESTTDSSAVEDEPSTADASSTPETTTSPEAPVAGTDESSEAEASDEAEATNRGPTRADDGDEDEDAAAEPPSPAETGPAFEYSDVQQKPFYARSETVTEFENQIRTTIVPTLAKANVLDEETREIHDAVLRLANEEPERIAELVLEERRQSQRE